MTPDLSRIVDDIMGNQRTIAFGTDHGGFFIKQELVTLLGQSGYSVMDQGTHSAESVHYPVFARKVAEAVRSGQAQYGIMVDGAGIGSAMVCNKVRGIRAAHCSNTFEAFNARAHNNANVLTLGARVVGIELLKRIITTFLETPFEGGRHAERVNMIMETEHATGKG